MSRVRTTIEIEDAYVQAMSATAYVEMKRFKGEGIHQFSGPPVAQPPS